MTTETVGGIALTEKEIEFLIAWRQADSKGKAEVDEALRVLSAASDRFADRMSAAFGSRPISSESDMVDFYRALGDPNLDDGFARTLWRTMQRERT